LKELDHLKDQFMVTASHELRTPLTAVQGYIELLAQFDDALGAEQKKEFLHKARRSCDELVIILENVMDASQLDMEGGVQTTHLERVPLQTMIDSIMNLLEPGLAKEKREVYLNIPAGLAVQADARHLSQVLLNLSVNALKYSSPTTPLAFSARIVRNQQQQSVVVSITDKGKGIAVQDQARLFQRFLRLESDINSPIRGSGLGLYISRRLIEAMGGKIWVESRGMPGEGSTFHVQLALA
jgi:signal transduction histidine kinase